MLGPSHKILGIAVGMAVADTLGLSPFDKPVEYACFVGLSILGSLLPDADEPKSAIGRAWYICWLPFYVIRGLAGVLGLIVPGLKKASKAMAHRGAAHSPFFWALIWAVLYYLPVLMPYRLYITGLFAGIVSHLFSDFLFGGIPLLFPFSLKRCRLPITFKSGGYVEFLAVGACITVGAVMVGMDVVRKIQGLLS